MIEETFHEIIRNEKYEWENELSKERAHCPFRYCPSSIQIRSIRMNGGEYYYLSSLPHFHKPSLYQGNPQDLPSFLQLVLYYNSGIEYFNQLTTQSTTSSSLTAYSTIRSELLDENKASFSTNWQENLHQTALNDFGTIPGRALFKFVRNSNLDGMHFYK